MIFLVPFFIALFVYLVAVVSRTPEGSMNTKMAVVWSVIGLTTIMGFIVFWPIGVVALIVACICGRGFISH